MLTPTRTVIPLKHQLQSQALAALRLLTTTTDPIEREKAFVTIRDVVENETSLISHLDLDSGVFDLYSIEWKWRLLSELSHDVSSGWAEAALSIYRWTADSP
jgi:hypothetical protein